MSRTITAMFDTREDAEAGRQRLIAANIDTDHVHIHDQSTEGFSKDDYSTDENRGMWGGVKNAYLPDEDRHTYEEGVRRGGSVLTADVDEDDVDRAVAALEETNSVDLEDRSKTWRNEGWAGPQAAAIPAVGAGWDRDRATAPADNVAPATTGNDEQKLNVVEERLVVGKRETGRGGVRVRSYVTEKPVHEQVRLREEHVNLERRPVDQKIDGIAGDAFQERTIELTERNEEAVVGKEARIVEEVVLTKTAGERTEDINETVRRTDVDVEQLDGSARTGERSAFGSTTDTGTSTGESLGDKARNAVADVKDGLGLGNSTDRR